MPAGKGQGSCGGVPRRDGSGGGVGNKGTVRQPPPISKPSPKPAPKKK